MACVVITMSFCIIISLSLLSISAETRVELTSPVDLVTVGGILAIQCKVSKIQSGFKVDFLRVLKNGGTDPLALAGNYLDESSLGQRGFLAKRTFSDGSMVLFLTVVDITPTDQGIYLCKVYSDLHGNYIEIARDSTNIEFYSFPSNPYPMCNSDPIKHTYQEHEQITLTCSSEKGFPTAVLTWSCTKNDVHFDIYDSQNEDSISSELTVTVDATHNGAVFVCKMTSPGFPARERSCTYGPLTVISNTGDIDVVISTGKSINKPSTNEVPFKTNVNKCETSCKSEDPYVLLYWAVACIGTTILMFIFLATTMIYCCKYQTISSEIVAADNSIISYDGSEPIYVSLQRRQASERNSKYMSVEDPNNPGNNVLMPREVFDEFYRSLSLKKGESRN